MKKLLLILLCLPLLFSTCKKEEEENQSNNTNINYLGYILPNSNFDGLWKVYNNIEVKICEFSGIEDFDFISEDIGFIMISGEGLFKTTDGGDNWNLESDFSGEKLDFISENIGYTNDGDGLYKTTDGGLTWILINDLMNIQELNFISEHIGFVVLDDGVSSIDILFKTIDGGLNWNKIDVNFTSDFSVQFLDEQVGFLAPNSTYDSELHKTIDGGNNWIFVANTSAEVGDGEFFFISDQIGYIKSPDEEDSYLSKTTDGGVTWNTLNISINPRRIQFFN